MCRPAAEHNGIRSCLHWTMAQAVYSDLYNGIAVKSLGSDEVGVFEKLLGVGGVALVLYGVSAMRKDNKIAAEQEAMEQSRINTPFRYPAYLTEEQFEKIAISCIKPIKRKFVKFKISNGKFYGTIISHSGITEWNFVVDFNDFGKLTGEYWLKTENKDSMIPKRVAESMRLAIRGVLNENTSRSKKHWRTDTAMTVPQMRTKEEQRITQKRKKRSRNRRRVFFAILIIIIAFIISVEYVDYQKLIPIGYSKEALYGNHYDNVILKLKDAGFTNIYTEEISDLSLSHENRANLVSDIQLEGLETFDENTKYHCDKSIKVVFHTLKLLSAPITSKESKGLNYSKVIDKFKESGFINIKINVKYDIITGWITENGAVESVAVDNNEQYDYYDKFRPDAEIVITYHAYRKDKPE